MIYKILKIEIICLLMGMYVSIYVFFFGFLVLRLVNRKKLIFVIYRWCCDEKMFSLGGFFVNNFEVLLW